MYQWHPRKARNLRLNFMNRLRVVSNFGDCDCGAGKIHTRAPFASRLLEISRARVYFARPTIAIAKIRDYSQSTL